MLAQTLLKQMYSAVTAAGHIRATSNLVTLPVGDKRKGQDITTNYLFLPAYLHFFSSFYLSPIAAPGISIFTMWEFLWEI